jgi:hypothetical protein
MLTRIAWVHAGHVSAKNWRLPLEIREPVTNAEQPIHSATLNAADQLKAGRL